MRSEDWADLWFLCNRGLAHSAHTSHLNHRKCVGACRVGISPPYPFKPQCPGDCGCMLSLSCRVVSSEELGDGGSRSLGRFVDDVHLSSSSNSSSSSSSSVAIVVVVVVVVVIVVVLVVVVIGIAVVGAATAATATAATERAAAAAMEVGVAREKRFRKSAWTDGMGKRGEG